MGRYTKREIENLKKKNGGRSRGYTSAQIAAFGKQAEQARNAKYTITAPDGTKLGDVDFATYTAIANGKFGYKPKSSESAKVIKELGEWVGYGKTADSVYKQYQKDAYGKGNIVLSARPIYKNKDGSISTVDSITIEEDGKHVLIPTIVEVDVYNTEGGKIGKKIEKLSDEEAVKYYHKNNEYLGKFDTASEANKYAYQLHVDQSLYYAQVPLTVEIDGKTKNYGSISYKAYKHFAENPLDTISVHYSPDEQANIKKFMDALEAQAKKEREPEDFWQGLVHSIGYSAENFGAGAVDFVEGAGQFLEALGAKALSIPAWGKAEETLNKYAADRLDDKTLGQEWKEGVESRYRVPDWYRKYGGTAFYGLGALAVPIAAEIATASLAPGETLAAGSLARMGTALNSTSRVAKLSATARNIASKLVKPKPSSALFGLGAGGSAAKSAYAQSGNLEQSINYGVLTGLGEVFTESLFGGIGGTSVGPDDIIDLSKVKVFNKIASTKYGKKVLDVAFEGVEEVIMDLADPLFQYATTKSDASFDEIAKMYKDKNLGETFFQGVLLSSLANAGTFTINKTINTTNKIKTIKDLNKSVEEINSSLPNDVNKFEPLKLTATADEINGRYSEIQRVKAINIVNSASSGINALFESDADKLELLKYDSTIEEIEQRQREIGVFAMAYADNLVEELVKNNPEKFAHIEKISVVNTPEGAKVIASAVDKVTNRTAEYYKYGADMNAISVLNTKFLASKGSGINSDFIKGYIDTFAEMIKANNSPVYKALSSDGVDIPKALYDYITTGKIPEGITNTKAFLNAAQTMKNILTEAITASVTAHKAIYGENATLDAQLEAIKNGDFSFLTQNEYNHLYDETKVSKEFLVSVSEEIENAIINIRKGDLDSVPDVIEVTELSPETIKKISDFVGFDISAYKCRIEKDALVHIEKRHGINGEHDQSLSDPKDTARMGYAINHIDNIEWVTDEKGNVVRSRKYNNKDNTSCPVMSLSSRIDGTYCVSQAVPDTKRKTIWVTSARIEKADGGSQVPNGRESTPQPTPKAPLVSSSADNNIPQNKQIVNNNGMQNSENNASKIVTLKQTGYIYSVFEDAKLIYEGADCITDKRVVIPKSTEAIDEISAVSDALIEVADGYKLARVYNKSNSVLIEGDPKVADDGYIFKIDGKFYACRQKDLDAFNNGKRTIKANTNEKIMWSVHNESGELVAVFMPLKTSSITEDMYNSLPYASEVIAKENSTDETSTKELKSQGENDTIEVDDADGIKYSIESEEITDKGYKKGRSTKIRYNPKGIKLPKAEREKFISSVSTDYYNSNKTHIGLQYQSCVTDKMHILYVYEDGGFGNYNPVARIDFADIDTANAVMEEIRNGTTYRITDLVNRVLQTFEIRRGGYTIYNAYSKKRISSRGNDSLSKGQSKSDTGRIDDGSKGTTRNKRGNESLDNSYSMESEADFNQENGIDSIDYSLEDTLPGFEQLIDNEVLHSVSVTKVKMRQFPSRKESSGSDTNKYCTLWSYREDVFAGDQTIVFHNGRCYVIEKYDDIEFKYQIVGRIRYADYTALREEILTDVRNNNESTIKGMVDIYNKRNRQGDWAEGRGQGSDSDSVEYRREDRQILQMDTNQDSGREIRVNSSGSDAHNSADRQTGGRVDNSYSLESEADFNQENGIDSIDYSLESGAESVDAGGESQHKSYGGADFDYSKTTQKIYTNRAWAYTLLSKEDLRLLNEKYYGHFRTNAYRKAKLSDGKTRVVEINNKLLFVSGTYNNPVIEAVLAYNVDNSTDMEILKLILFSDVVDNDYSKHSLRRIKSDTQIYDSLNEIKYFDFYERADYTSAVEKNGWGAKIEDGRKAFGYTGSFTIRDGIYRKDESRVSKNSESLSNTDAEYSFVDDNEYDVVGFRNEKAVESEAENEQGNNILNGSEQRDVGKRPGEQTGRVGKSSRRGSEKTIRERQGFLRGLKADQKEEKILTDSAGRKHKFTVVKKSAWNEHMKNLAAFYEAQGVTVEYIDGGISIAFLGGKHLARGMRNGDTIYVSYNNRRFSPEQIAEHEFIHNKYKTDAVQEAKKQILERMPEEEYNKAIEKIEEAYSGIVNKTALEEELICNILSGMYENTAEYADIANEYWSKTGSNISGYDVSQYAESIDAGGELNESGNTQELGEQGISENNDSVWQRSDDSEGVYERLGTGEERLYRSQEKGNRHIDWSRGFGNLDVYEPREKERAYGILRKISQLNIASQDSDGRKLSKEQMRFFKDTVAKNSKGELFTLYHATDAQFNEFLFGDFAFHVGTLGQATKLKKEFLKEVYVNIKNPVFISEDPMHWPGFAIASKLEEQHIITSEEYDRLSLLEGFYGRDYNAEANKEIRSILKDKGYDGIVYNNGFEGDSISFMAFDSNQIKYTSNKNPTTNSELNYSFVDDNEYDFDDFWNEAVETYGAIPEGEKPAREVSVPKKISDTEPVSYFARTMMEAGVTPDEALSEFEQAILDGTMSHEVITDKRALRYAQETIKRDGFDQAMEDWSRDSARGKVGKKDLAVGMELYNQCVNNKDYKNAMKIAAELAAEATRAGQTLQACRLLKQMSPDGQLYYLEKSVAKMNEEFKQQLGKKFEDIELDEELMEEFYTAESEEQRNEVYDRICQNIADQMPATLLDKWNSWRYLAMLGNPRTHIRNIIGNAVFVPAIRIKNYTGAALEQALKVDTSERTKSFTKSKEAVEFAKKDFNEMVKVLQGVNAKYAVTSDIDSKRQIFKTKALEKLRTKNFEFLEMEDMWFLKTHYVDALARIITARKLDVDNIDADTLGKVRAYAVKEAQAATYRDANVLAEGLNKLQRKAERSGNKAIRATSYLVEGIMPFKKTPLNIAKQGVQYSPVSLLTGVYQLTKGVKEETHTVADAIDTLSKGITGTGLMLLGYFLAQMGILVGEEEEPDKKKEFDEMNGQQSYAIKIGDFSYTIDWAAPACLPLFVGVALRETTQDGSDVSFTKVVNSLITLPDPLLELSVFSSISNMISTAKYNEGNEVSAITIEIGASYLSQAFPSIGGQLSRVKDSTKREYYYYDRHKDMPKFMQIFVGKAASKIPFVSYLFEPSVDVWGREETYGGTLERVAENFVSPGYYSEERYTEVDKELQALYEKTGKTEVLPVEQKNYYEKDGITYYMTAEQYTEAKKIRGQKSFELVEQLLADELKVKLQNKETKKYVVKKFSQMTDEEKVRAIEKCYDKAGEFTQEQMFDKVKGNTEK